MSNTNWFSDPNTSASNFGESSSPKDTVVTLDGFHTKIAQEVAGNLIQSTKSQAKGFIDVYANIDLIRPYFDVDGKEVLMRLMQSLLPRPNSNILNNHADLYGPVMLVFTLISILLLGMKLSHTSVEEGTLMGTAFIICFTYWILTSLLFYFSWLSPFHEHHSFAISFTDWIWTVWSLS